MSKKKNVLSTIILVIMLLVGLSVMLYPTISDWWNSKVQSRAIAAYTQAVAQLDNDAYEEMLEKAREYNDALADLNAPFSNYEQISGYEELLDILGTGIMGYISIPKISVEIPIYHGTGESVLNIAVGHLQGSSLPVGGENTHAVISGHRGLPNARLFTDLDQLAVGDTFTITVLDEVMTYEVEEILIVKPDEMDKLAIIPGEDYVTLMTCTPYGVNTHRLLLRSHRIDTIYETTVRVAADAVQVDPMLVVPVIVAPILLVLLGYWMFGGRKSRKLPYSYLLYKQPEQKSNKEG